jgi:hypothetical protein
MNINKFMELYKDFRNNLRLYKEYKNGTPYLKEYAFFCNSKEYDELVKDIKKKQLFYNEEEDKIIAFYGIDIIKDDSKVTDFYEKD